jgi:hypothetical protein
MIQTIHQLRASSDPFRFRCKMVSVWSSTMGMGVTFTRKDFSFEHWWDSSRIQPYPPCFEGCKRASMEQPDQHHQKVRNQSLISLFHVSKIQEGAAIGPEQQQQRIVYTQQIPQARIQKGRRIATTESGRGPPTPPRMGERAAEMDVREETQCHESALPGI